jgi:hypothetical protein
VCVAAGRMEALEVTVYIFWLGRKALTKIILFLKATVWRREEHSKKKW